MNGSSIVKFLQELHIDARLPKGVEVLDPYSNPVTLELTDRFYKKYYHETKPRTLLLGINPGRFGSGLTGISFTDPIKLEKICGIPNDLPKKAELSGDFVYAMIESYGGPEAFYSEHFISSVCPLGFIKDGVNINYYDIPALQKAVTPFIVKSINELIAIGGKTERVFIIGEGDNFKFFNKLNLEHQWFTNVLSLPHPRFIMQYRRKRLKEYVDQWLHTLSKE